MEGQRGEGRSKRAAPDGDEGESSKGVKRARGGKPGYCEHNRQRNKCKECGGASICQHARITSRCKECGGSSRLFPELGLALMSALWTAVDVWVLPVIKFYKAGHAFFSSVQFVYSQPIRIEAQKGRTLN